VGIEKVFKCGLSNTAEALTVTHRTLSAGDMNVPARDLALISAATRPHLWVAIGQQGEDEAIS